MMTLAPSKRAMLIWLAFQEENRARFVDFLDAHEIDKGGAFDLVAEVKGLLEIEPGGYMIGLTGNGLLAVAEWLSRPDYGR